jgi:hypothetical protein
MARSGKNTFLPDRFDDLPRDPSYVGRHRRERTTWSTFAPIGIGLGTVVVLVLAGLWFIDRSDDYLTLDPSDFPIAAEPPEEPVVVEPEVEPEQEVVTDPTQVDLTDFTLTVLNGTSTQGLAARAAERLVAVGWPEATATNADSSDVAETVVTFGDEVHRAKALGIAQLLGVDETQVIQTTAYPGASVTVVLGADYVDTQST